MQITKQKIRDIIKKYTNVSEWRDSAELFGELEIDSINFIKIIIEIEQELGREIPSDYLVPEKWMTVDMIWNTINN